MSMISRVSGSFTIPQIKGYSILHCSNGAEVPQVNAVVTHYFDESLIGINQLSEGLRCSTDDYPFLSSMTG